MPRSSASTRSSGTTPLVLDKWFALQAGAQEHEGKVFERVKRLLAHPDFKLANPEPGAQPDRHLLPRQPGGIPSRRRRRLRLLGRPGDRPRRDQSAGRIAHRPGPRPLEPPRRALSLGGARGDRAGRRAGQAFRRHAARSCRAPSSQETEMASRKPRRKNAFYAQSGGVTAVINASAAGVIETARAHRDTHRHRLRRPQRHHRRAHRGPDRHRQGVGRGDPGAALHALGRVRLLPLQAEVARYQPARVRAADRGLPGARHRLVLLQRRRRLGRHLLQGEPALGQPRLSAAGDPRAEDRRQRPADHRLLPGLRLGGEVRGGVGARGLVRRALDGPHLDQGVRARGDGPARRLDRRGRRPDRGRTASRW